MAIERDQFGILYSGDVGSSGANVNPNSNSNSRASANAGSVTTKKKRRKPIKSCTFCRKRKLRCDQQKPMCSTCVARGLSECFYLEMGLTPHTVVQTGSGSRSSVPDAKLLRKVNELEKQLQDVASKVNGANKDGQVAGVSRDSIDLSVNIGSTQPGSVGPTTVLPLASTDSTTVNPLRNLHYIQLKKNGRSVVYGPTSFRTFMANESWGLLKRYQQLRKKVKAARNQMKKQCGYTMLTENALIEKPLYAFSNNQMDTSLVKQLIYVLPSYERMERIIKQFFSQPDLHQFTGAFDESKVLADFKKGFIGGEQSPSTGERPIVEILPNTKLNYYKVGVVLGIVVLVDFECVLPSVIEKFFVFLSGLSTAKIMYLERVQFTLLRYGFRHKWGLDGGDDSHMIPLIDSMVCDAVSMGLNRDIRTFFQDKEDLVGSVESLEKPWCWVLLLDLHMAFNIGKPLKLNDDSIFHEEFLEDNSPGFYGLLKRFLKVGRPIVSAIFNRNACPDLDRHAEDILKFIEDQFPPISFYTDRNLFHKTSLYDTRIFCFSLSILLALNGLRCFTSSFPLDAKNSVAQVSLVAIHLARNLMSHCMELDKQFFPETLRPDFMMASPYFCLASSTLHALLVRAMPMPYILAYQKLTIFESALTVIDESDNPFNWDLSTLRVPSNRKIPIIPALSMYCKIYDELSNPKDPHLKMIQKRYRPLQILHSIEKVCRTVVEKVLECRTTSESSWKTQVHRQNSNSPEKLLSPSMVNLEKTDLGFLGSFGEQSRPVKLLDSSLVSPASFSTPSRVPEDASNVSGDPHLENHEINTLDKKCPSLSSPGQESDIMGMISDEFWQSYNDRWAELLNNAESGQLFPDMNI
ncbi:YRM1 (YOR172W) [Zygosaccharomyces parabailii]|nr:YRM1 (YOR172W) [Zygosaccharomyces parabailii]